jgi:drug/metabolite transporter (DMT)-like permease
LATVVSRLSLFMGLKRLGGVQTALIGLSELLVTVLSAQVLLGDKLLPIQWLGAALLAGSILLVVRERGLGVLPVPKPWLPLISARFGPPGPTPIAPPPPVRPGEQGPPTV